MAHHASQELAQPHQAGPSLNLETARACVGVGGGVIGQAQVLDSAGGGGGGAGEGKTGSCLHTLRRMGGAAGLCGGVTLDMVRFTYCNKQPQRSGIGVRANNKQLPRATIPKDKVISCQLKQAVGTANVGHLWLVLD